MDFFIWAILASCCWGVAPMFEKVGLRGSSDPALGVVIRTIGVVLGALSFFLFVPRLASRAAAFPPRAWFFVGMGGLLASVIGQYFFYRALKTGPVSQVVPIGASYPALACILGVLFFRESMTWLRAAGVALVIVGTFLLR